MRRALRRTTKSIYMRSGDKFYAAGTLTWHTLNIIFDIVNPYRLQKLCALARRAKKLLPRQRERLLSPGVHWGWTRWWGRNAVSGQMSYLWDGWHKPFDIERLKMGFLRGTCRNACELFNSSVQESPTHLINVHIFLLIILLCIYKFEMKIA